tara:strand:- start:212 stop:508 length:297 start_codon:yes stop_codon:yes gene_type:complete
MKILKIFFIISGLVFVSGCIQTTSLLGPGVTVATSGNLLQAGFQYGANRALKNETGKDILSHIKNTVDEKNKKKNFQVKLRQLLKNRIENTRQKLLSN